MDAETGAMLALQILALCSIVAALLAYLVRQSRSATNDYDTRSKRYVLVTSCDTGVGLQIALALAEAGYKVFAGLLDREGNSTAAKILRALNSQKCKEGEIEAIPEGPLEGSARIAMEGQGQIILLDLNPTREDSLHACLDVVRARLPAGEDGLWAVVHTGGLALAGAIERQESAEWESMLRHNLVAPLRTARAFIPLLRAKRGRMVLLGDSERSGNRNRGLVPGAGLVAFSASRRAVEGAAEALRSELLPSGVDVVLLKPPPISPHILYGSPMFKRVDVESGLESPGTTWKAPLPSQAIRDSLVSALTAPCPEHSYDMAAKPRFFCSFNGA